MPMQGIDAGARRMSATAVSTRVRVGMELGAWVSRARIESAPWIGLAGSRNIARRDQTQQILSRAPVSHLNDGTLLFSQGWEGNEAACCA